MTMPNSAHRPLGFSDRRSAAAELNNIATSLLRRGDFDEALEMYQGAFSTMIASTTTGQASCSLSDENSQISTPQHTMESEQTTSMSCVTPDSKSHEDEPPNVLQTRVVDDALQISAGFEVDLDGDKNDLARVVYNMGLLYCMKGSLQTAEQLFEMALETVPSELCDHFVVQCAALNNLGHIHFVKDQFDHAVKKFTDALSCAQKVLRSANESMLHESEGVRIVRRSVAMIATNQAVAMYSLAEEYENRGLSKEAMVIYIQILKLRPSTNNRFCDTEGRYSYLLHSLVLYRVGNIHYESGQNGLAIQAFQFSLHLLKKALGSRHSDVIYLVNKIGTLQLDMGMTADALESFKECLQLQRSILGSYHRKVGETMYRIARIYQVQGEYREALRFYTETLAVERVCLGAEHPDFVITLTNIAQTHYSFGHLDEALKIYRDVLDMVRRTMGENHPSTVEILNIVGTIHLDKGQHDEAVAAFTEANKAGDGRIDCRTENVAASGAAAA